MRQFYEEWCPYVNRQPSAGDLNWSEFIAVSFSHHMEIIAKTGTIEERIFYIHECATSWCIMEEISNRLTNNYGKGFNVTSLFRMVKFYQEFSNPEILATLSQQLTWSHFVELLPIEDPLKRDF